MAKKFVRGVTGVDDIEKFDKTLTNVNDLISDGQNTYVHTKKGKVESYYKLTDNIQTISSSGNTITVQKGDNGSVTLNTNPQKVLEHGNLLTDYGISKTTSGDTSTLELEYTLVSDGFDLNTLNNGRVRGTGLVNAPTLNNWFFIESRTQRDYTIQTATTINNTNTTFIRQKTDGVWGEWREQVGDKSAIDTLLAQKQNKLSTNTSIAVLDNEQLRQLIAFRGLYNQQNGLLKTHIKSIAENISINTPKEEFNFIVKVNKGVASVNFTLNERDTNKFASIISTYGQDNTVRISGCVFTLAGSTLTVSPANNANQNYVITFSDII